MAVIVYDVEVLRGPDEVEGGWNNPEAMGFGTAVAYNYLNDQYYFYGADDKAELIKLLQSNTVVSFNGIKFDNRVVLGNDYSQNTRLWRDVDILLMVVQSKFGLPDVVAAETKLGDREVHDGSISLDGLAEGTLRMHKTGSGAHAPKLIREGKWPAVFAYNLHDVRLTRMLYDFMNKYGYLVDRRKNQISF